LSKENQVIRRLQAGSHRAEPVSLNDVYLACSISQGVILGLSDINVAMVLSASEVIYMISLETIALYCLNPFMYDGSKSQ